MNLTRRQFLAGSAAAAVVTVPMIVPATTLPEPELLERYRAFIEAEGNALRVLTQRSTPPVWDKNVRAMFYDKVEPGQTLHGFSYQHRPFTEAITRAPAVLNAIGIPLT